MKGEEAKIQNRIFICLCIIIGLLTINTIILIVKDGTGSSSKSNESEVIDPNYDTSKMTKATLSDILGYFEDGDTKVVYMGRKSCSACVTFLPILQQAQDDYGYKTVYLDIETVSQKTSEYSEFIEKLDKEYSMKIDGEMVTKEYGQFYGYTPAVFIIKDGKMVDGFIGADSYSSFTSFLENNGIKK